MLRNISYVGISIWTPYVKKKGEPYAYSEVRLYLSGAQDSYDHFNHKLETLFYFFMNIPSKTPQVKQQLINLSIAEVTCWLTVDHF